MDSLKAVEAVQAHREALEHEHARAYDACETAAQRLELAGHDLEAALVRTTRRRVAEHIAAQACDDGREAPPRLQAERLRAGARGPGEVSDD